MVKEKIQRQQLTSKQYGFIITVFVVISVFFAFATSSYCDYTDRARAAEGLALASSAKSAIAEYYANHEAFPPDNATAGLAAPTDIHGNAISSIEISTTGNGSEAKALITITYNKKLYEGQTIIISTTPPKNEESFVWDCTDGTLSQVYRPPECRDSSKIRSASESLPQSTGILVFILCFVCVKTASFLVIKKYSVFKFFLEVIVAVTLFQIIDYVYIMYFLPFYPKGFFYVQPFVHFLAGTFLNLIAEPIYANVMQKTSKKEKEP